MYDDESKVEALELKVKILVSELMELRSALKDLVKDVNITHIWLICLTIYTVYKLW
jgi:hypothetical protein